MKALITGSGGLVGSACVRHFADAGYEVIGVDNDMRRQLFGPLGTTLPVTQHLSRTVEAFRSLSIDIRDRSAIRDLMQAERPDCIVHAAAQPSHDKAAHVPYEDFDINATGTLNLLVAARDYCPDAPFCFTSTNKVYGDRPNAIPLVETETRYDYADSRDGIDENLSVDACLHSLFGASKLSADLLAQEFGRYFGMPVGIFRCGCLTGPEHAAVELHGYLTYIVACAVLNRPYTINGYKGKQVRDQIDAIDVAALFLAFCAAPRCGEVYNLGGGRENSLSILETIAKLRALGYDLDYTVSPSARIGDHICYITDLSKISKHFPEWRIQTSVDRCIEMILEAQLKKRNDKVLA